MAWFKVAVGKLTEAEKLIAQANTAHNKFAGKRLELLKARILMGQGKHQEAKEALALLLNAHLGEEPRYNMALCHLRLGETETAVKILNGITKSFRKGTSLWRRTEKEWYRSARQTLREVQNQK